MLLTSAALVLAQVTAGGSLGVPGEDLSRGVSCVVGVSSSQSRSEQRGGIPSFSAARILDLRFRALLSRVHGPQILHLKVFTPRGYLYQTLTVPFGPHETRRAGEPLRFQVSATLPVAGTTIMTDGLYGQWKVEPWLDGSATPCGVAKAFVISP